MAKRRSTTKRKRSKICAPWSDLNNDVLNIIIMQLEVVDFLSFSGVCKSWRSFAHSYGNTFMASKPPMSITISTDSNEKACYLKDYAGRKLTTILPDFTGGDCIGLTCGYLIFFTKATHDFWLVNPITRHQLHFPNSPFKYHHGKLSGRAILVFSASISEWVFVVLFKYCYVIWFCIAGKGAWNRVSYPRAHIIDVYAFKGKIYTLTYDTPYHLCELRLGPRPKLTLLAIKTPDFFFPDQFISSHEKLYVTYHNCEDPRWFLELDFGKMKWGKPSKKTMEEYAFFSGDVNHGVAVKRESWADPRSQMRYADTDNDGGISFFNAKMWYLPHECMNVDRID